MAQRVRMIETAGTQCTIDLAPTLQMDLNELVGQQLAVFGMPGFGKTNAVALLCEQIAPYLAPMVIFDKEGDFASLVDFFPRGVLATADNCPSGRDILQRGLQVVYNLSSWSDDHVRSEVMVTIIYQLLDYVNSRPASERVPCVIMVDEAQYWLPENRGSHLKRQEFLSLSTAFSTVGSTGRKRGFTPFYACPKISELSKSILYPGMYMFFRATLHTDVKRYMEYIHSSNLTPAGLKKNIESMPKGRAFIKLPNGRQRQVTLHMRESEHISHTPTVQAALNAYGSMPFDPDESYGMFLPDSELEPSYVTPEESSGVVKKNQELEKNGLLPYVNGELSMNNPEFAALLLSQRFRLLFSIDPHIDAFSLSELCGSSLQFSGAWLTKQKSSQNHTIPGQAKKQASPRQRASKDIKAVLASPSFETLSKTTRVEMLIKADPSLQTADLAKLLKCDTTSVSVIRSKMRKKERDAQDM